MTGLEPVVVGFLIRWATERARKVGERVDSKLDKALEALVDRVLAKIGGDSAVRQLQRESAEGIDNPRTVQRAELALAEAVEQDEGFADALRALVTEVERLSPASGPVVINAHASGNAQQAVAGRDMTVNFGRPRD